MDRGCHAEEICELTKIDPWFIHQIEELTAMNRRAASVTVETASKDLLHEVKRHGASDEQLAQIWRTTPASVRLQRDRKSTRLNSSHGYISYAVFCLKKKKFPPLDREREQDDHSVTVLRAH